MSFYYNPYRTANVEIPLFERRRYVDDDGIEVIEYETEQQMRARIMQDITIQEYADMVMRSVVEYAQKAGWCATAESRSKEEGK